MDYAPGAKHDPINSTFPGKAASFSTLQKKADAENAATEGKSISFGDLVDVVNPLQHIPGVSTVYREVTGDDISGTARVVGGTLYGGPLGLLASGFDAAIAEESGQDMGSRLMAAVGLGGAEPSTGSTTRTAAATDASAPAANMMEMTTPAVASHRAESGADTSAARTASTAATAGTDGNAQQSGATSGGTGTQGDGALPYGLASVLPPAATAQSGNATPSRTATTAAATSSNDAGSAARGDDKNVLEGNNALAAFARDMQETAGNTARDRATAARDAATGSSRSGSARENGADSGANRAMDSQQANAMASFMKLRDSDYSTSAEMRARSQRLQQLQAQQANNVTPEVDARHVEIRETDGGQPADGIAGDATQPPDFAERMKQALQKYRHMHDGG